MTLSGICTVSNGKPCPCGDLEHVQVDGGALVAGEADETDLAGLLRGEQRLDGAAGREDPIGSSVRMILVDLHQIDVVGLQAAQRLVELRGRRLAVRPSILVIRKTRSR